MHNKNGVQNFRAILALIVMLGNFVRGGFFLTCSPLLFFTSEDILKAADDMLEIDFVKLKERSNMKYKRVDSEFVRV